MTRMIKKTLLSIGALGLAAGCSAGFDAESGYYEEGFVASAGSEESVLQEVDDDSLYAEEDIELGSTQQAIFGSDACKRVDICITNGGDEVRDIRYVRYYDASDGKWRKEDLANRDLGPGERRCWASQTLEYTKNDIIREWRPAYYRPGTEYPTIPYSQEVIPTPPASGDPISLGYGERCQNDGRYNLRLK
jgi:hypothetical protein